MRITGDSGFSYGQEPQRSYPYPATAVARQPTLPPATIKPSPTSPATPTISPSTDATSPPNQPTPLPVPLLLPPDDIIQEQVIAQDQANLLALLSTDFPPHDYFESVQRLTPRRFTSRTVTRAAYKVGDTQTFLTDDGQVEATLLGLTDHAYFWVENSLNYDRQEVQAIADRLETEFYPRLVNLFGQEWQPGMDNDPHFSVLHIAGETDASELGYFSSVDAYPRELYADSNEQEMVYLIMGNLELGEDLYYGTLVHELQHLIQWYIDPNEETWLNEGLSQLAEIYLGFHTATAVDYIRNPDTRLNTWDYDSDAVDAHYSAAYLFAVYVWEQLGETAVQELARHPANGMAAVHAILQGHAPDRSLQDFVADWVAANFLDDADAGPRYQYENLDLGRPAFEWRVKQLPWETTAELDPFATHYVELDVRGPITLTFAGDTTVNLIDAPPRSGATMWYAPAQDDTNADLTAVFDLTNLSTATFSFAAWYDLEEEYDFAYLSISTDNGQSWQLLSPNHGTAGEYGPAFNGRSDDERDHQNGWVKERISLNSYVGRPIMLRFDVLTDSAVSGRGFAVDDLAIPELNYFSDVESETPEWAAQGFVRAGHKAPQLWAVQLIEDGPIPTVLRLPLNELNQGQWRLEIGKAGGVLAITPLTPFVDAPANYWLMVEEGD
jgi:immune inhibitor A